MKDCNFRLLVGDAKHAVILIKYADDAGSAAKIIFPEFARVSLLTG